MSFWEQFRSLCHSMRDLFWALAIMFMLSVLLVSAVTAYHTSPDITVFIISIFFFILAIWASTPPKDPPEDPPET